MTITLNKTGAFVAVKNLIKSAAKDADSVMSKEHVDTVNKDLEILWKLPLEKGIPENVKQAASKAIPEILSSELCSEKTKEKYIEMAKKSMKNWEQVYSNLWFIKTLLINSQSKYGEVRKMNAKYNIFKIILSAGDAYLSRLVKLFANPYDYGNINQIEEFIASKEPGLMSGRTHKEHIEKMFEIIQYIIERSDSQSPFEDNEIDNLFNIFITKRISNVESEMLFDLISREDKSSKGYDSEEYLISDKKIRKYIFQTCLCK